MNLASELAFRTDLCRTVSNKYAILKSVQVQSSEIS